MVLMALAALSIGFSSCGNQQTACTGPDCQTSSPPATQKDTADAATAPTQLKDTVVIPGERVGPVTSETSRQQLEELFGQEALTDRPVEVGEGFTEPGTRVDLGEGRSFTLVWQDEEHTRPLMAMEFGPAWTTPEGLGIGSSLAALQKALGPFQVYGFGWDYEGTLVLEGSQLDQYHGDLFLRVQPETAMIEEHDAAYKALQGDAVFASDNPDLESLQPQVYDMVVYLNSLSE